MDPRAFGLPTSFGPQGGYSGGPSGFHGKRPRQDYNGGGEYNQNGPSYGHGDSGGFRRGGRGGGQRGGGGRGRGRGGFGNSGGSAQQHHGGGSGGGARDIVSTYLKPNMFSNPWADAERHMGLPHECTDIPVSLGRLIHVAAPIRTTAVHSGTNDGADQANGASSEPQASVGEEDASGAPSDFDIPGGGGCDDSDGASSCGAPEESHCEESDALGQHTTIQS